MSIIDILSAYPDFSESTAMETCDEDYRIYILVNKQLNLSPGKVGAQVGHGIADIVENMISDKRNRKIWRKYKACGSTKIVLKAKTTQELISVLDQTKHLQKTYVIDQGRTQCPPDSLTVVVYYPIPCQMVPSCIKNLSLY